MKKLGIEETFVQKEDEEDVNKDKDIRRNKDEQTTNR